ncbi:MAG: histidine kinase dimerization/phospho-acceptor domain-containing protein [Humidesulfovibrio sp.]|nr:histidine kinase dimerization/phospho-acceptor domain-containing protein [Humidesulfovibrio sp.]
MNPSLPQPEPGHDVAAEHEEQRRQRIHALAPLLTYTRKPGGDHDFTSACGNTGGVFGWEPDRLVAERKFWRDGLHPDDAPLVAQALASLPERGDCSIAYRLRAPLGEYGWFLDTMALVQDAEGKPAEIVGYLLDISRSKKLELELKEQLLAARAASQAKSEFLANMSHELTTPLNAVIGFSEVLQDRYFGELTAKQDEYVATIRDSGLRLLALLTDILQLAKIDAGDAPLNLDPASPAALMRTAMEMLREKALRHGIAMELDLGPEMEPETPLDEVKFRQVLFVLLGNAVKYTPDNGKVRCSGHRVWKDGTELLEISVEDSGPGIASEFAPHLFTPFARVEPAQAAAGQGTGLGLGLALARRLARLQGGDVALANTSALGSRLEFRLPVDPVAPTPIQGA